MGSIDRFGTCIISAVTTNAETFHLKIEDAQGSSFSFMRQFPKFPFPVSDAVGRCRWCSVKGEPLLFVKHKENQLNLLDTEKKTLLLKNPIQLEKKGALANNS